MSEKVLRSLRLIVLSLGIMGTVMVAAKSYIIDSYKICQVEGYCDELSDFSTRLEARIKKNEEFIHRFDERMINVQAGIVAINRKLDRYDH